VHSRATLLKVSPQASHGEEDSVFGTKVKG